MIDASRGGADPRVYHATNVMLHAAAASLVMLLASAWGAARAGALAAALIFAVHPVNVQAVAWVAGRNDLLVAVFGVLAVLVFPTARSGAQHPDVAQPFRAAAHVLFFTLALFSKESGLLFPPLAAVHERLFGRRLTRVAWIALSCDTAIVGLWIVLRGRALSGMPPELSAGAFGTGLTNLPHLLVHAGKILAPLRLNVSPGVDTTGMLVGAAAVAAFAFAAWRSTTRSLELGTRSSFRVPRSELRVVLMPLMIAVWVLAFLLPTLLVPDMPAYEHRAYVPLIGVCAGAAAWLNGGRRTPGFVARAVMVPVIAVFAVLAHQRQDAFRDAFAYWSDGTRDARFGPIAHVNLGQLHEAAGRPADARREYLRALERDPNTPKAHNNLGVVLMGMDEPELAVRHFNEETSRHPWNADAWFNLGLWSESQRDHTEARRYYQRALEADPGYLPAREKLAATAPAAREP